MFPDFWTSSNLLKITFNLYKQTERNKKQNPKTGGDKYVERLQNKRIKRERGVKTD